MIEYQETGADFDVMDEPTTGLECPHCGSVDTAGSVFDDEDTDWLDRPVYFCFDCQSEFRL